MAVGLRHNRRARLFALAVLSWWLVLAGCTVGPATETDGGRSAPAPAETAATVPVTGDASGGEVDAGGEAAVVLEVVDGDTIRVALGGRTYDVRYIGVDTPETKHPTVGVECFGREASARNRELVAGRTVRLERDISETDRYGRLLRYVWAGDTLVNEQLVREGYAAVSTYPPDVKHQDRFLAAEREARGAGRGLWAACGDADTPVNASGPGEAGGCDPSYPDVCIPPVDQAGDLDCGDLEVRGFRVVGDDPHRLDGNGDGVACEGGAR